MKRRITALTTFTLVLALSAFRVSAESQSVTIRVEGMHCKGCAASIEKKLKATPGVEDARVSFEKKEAWIKYDDQKISVAKLREVINSTGFKAVEEEPAARDEERGI